jgi:hypothetical protein
VPLLIVLLPQYGGGALLIREVARRTGRGWPTMLLLALAYGLVEEGFTTQSLFNPNYAGQRLLDYGYVPALGTSLNWAVFVLTIHVVWSISTPVLIAEGVAAERRAVPWLRRPGLAIAAALFLAGSAITIAFSLQASRFVASTPQFLAVAVLVVLAVAAAFLVFRPGGHELAGTAPPAWLAGVAALALASAFELVRHLFSHPGIPPAASLAAMLVCELLAILLIASWSRRSGWGGLHLLAIAAGAVLTYSWVSLRAFIAGRTDLGAPVGPVDDAGQVVLALAILGLIGWGALRTRRAVLPSAPCSVGSPGGSVSTG